MINYNNDMERHVVQSIARIFDLAGIPAPGKTREEQEVNIQHLMTTQSGRSELSASLEYVLTKVEKGESLNGIVTRQHIKNVLRLVNITTEDLPKISIEKPATQYFTTAVGEGVLKRLKMYKNTVMRYHDLEVYTREALLKDLHSIPGMEAATIDVVKVSKEDLVDETVKSVYMGQKPWVYYPMLPMVILRTNTED